MQQTDPLMVIVVSQIKAPNAEAIRIIEVLSGKRRDCGGNQKLHEEEKIATGYVEGK